MSFANNIMQSCKDTERHYFATFASCVAPGHIADNVIFLIYNEYLSIISVPIVNSPGVAGAVV